jgi:hypothetical protein
MDLTRIGLTRLVEELELERLTPDLPDEGVLVGSGYASDLLSDVLAHAREDGVLVTVQVHLNVVAVALHAGVAAVIFALGRRPDETVRAKATEEGVRLYGTRAEAFDVVGRLYALGVRGGS